MGYADIGPFGKDGYPNYPTPQLDRMAAEGRIFTDFQVPQAVCSASRAAIMTGCYSNRVSILGAMFPGNEHGINAEETTIAEICKQKTTPRRRSANGIWAIIRSSCPVNHGFDEYFGLPYSNDMWPWTYDNTRAPKDHPKGNGILAAAGRNTTVVDADVTPGPGATDHAVHRAQAVDFIRRNKDRPFFVYLPTRWCTPIFVSEKFKGSREPACMAT